MDEPKKDMKFFEVEMKMNLTISDTGYPLINFKQIFKWSNKF